MDKLSPPHDIDSERAVVSGLIRQNARMNDVCDLVKAADFYDVKLRTVMVTIEKLYAESRPFDPVTIRHQLTADGALKQAGGVVGLSEMMEAVSVVSNIEYYAGVVAEKARLRKLIGNASSTIARAHAPDADSKAIMETIDSEMSDISGQLTGTQCVALADIVQDGYDYIAQTFTSGVSGIKTHFNRYDAMTGGLHPGELVVIAGRPAMGKTAFGLNIAENISRSGLGSLIFSLEMSNRILGLRMIAGRTGIPLTNLLRGTVDQNQWDTIIDARDQLKKLPMHIIDRGEMSIIEMRAHSRKYARKHGLGLIMVDYLQLMKGSGRADNRNAEIGQISRGLKALAKELSVPVIALSQLSRAVENRGGKRRPILSDLRESGEIEQDADLVCFLYRPEYYGENSVEIDRVNQSSENMAEGIIAKHRNGPVGSFWMRFDKENTTFQNLEWRREYDDGR